MVSNSAIVPAAGKPRVCVISQRDIRKSAAWCSLYEFEDVISEIDDVIRINLAGGLGFSFRKHAVSSLVWRQISKTFARLNPGLKPISIDSEYEIFFFGCINPWELLFLNGVHGWKEKCRVKICYLYEMWGGVVPRYAHLLSLLNDFDYVFLGWQSSVQPVQNVTSAPCHHVSPAVDTLRFSPFPNPPARSIDVFSMGRRLEAMHEQLLGLASSGKIFYIYDTLPAECLRPSNHRQHRDLFANIGKRTRFFITYPAKVDCYEETRGLSEAGTRFYEGVATGAIMVGQAPDSETFKREFNWPESVINIGDRVENLTDLMAAFRQDSDRYERLSMTNALQGLKRHDWAYRWNEILNISGVTASPKLAVREARLGEVAAGATQTCIFPAA